ASSLMGMPGGQPSTTTPIAGPWLSPQLVKRKRCPNVLCDMAVFLACGRSRRDRPERQSRPGCETLLVPVGSGRIDRGAAPCEVNHGILRREPVYRPVRREVFDQPAQRAQHPAMRNDNGAARQLAGEL